jgi:DNA-directed RNA polymerase subunit RPC12/RpoP
MDDRTQEPAFHVDRVLLSGLIPIARYYSCIRCGHDLTDWVMTQSPNQGANCPQCGVRIDERDIAQAQRDTKLGPVWTLLTIVCLILGVATLVGMIWVMTGPQPLIRFG